MSVAAGAAKAAPTRIAPLPHMYYICVKVVFCLRSTDVLNSYERLAAALANYGNLHDWPVSPCIQH